MQFTISRVTKAVAQFRGYQSRMTSARLNPFPFDPDLSLTRKHRQDLLDRVPMGWGAKAWIAPLFEN